MGLFSRKKPRRISFLGSTIKDLVTRDIEKADEEENTNVKNPICRRKINFFDYLKIPAGKKRDFWWRLTQEELEYYGIVIKEESQKESEQELPVLPEQSNPPELPEPTNLKKELLSNELVKDNAPLRAHILSETKEKLEKDVELENLDESEQEKSDEEDEK